ncbi:hypothetical protein [Pannonibacter phragmitetus]|uniref:hypothetical protein n=1 Tax=Pannonibacter phragmitetus TaxID=121719 RepID=UPI0013DDECF6|nr:hypothetical protein [Pannonibacter phragmitetus]
MASISEKVVVYLDTQDYSRFGDVLRRVSRDEEIDRVFRELVQFSDSGKVIFPTSFVIMSELIQYDKEYRDTSLSKAQAVETLSKGWSFIYPTEIIDLWRRSAEFCEWGKVGQSKLLNQGYGWYPNLDKIVKDLRSKKEERFYQFIESAKNRKERRYIKSKINKTPSIRDIDEIIAYEFGFVPKSFKNYIVNAIFGNKELSYSSLDLFKDVAAPVAFVKFYYEWSQGSKDMPFWAHKIGQGLITGIDKLVEILKSIADDNNIQFQFEEFKNEFINIVHNEFLQDSISSGGFFAGRVPSEAGRLDENPSISVISLVLCECLRSLVRKERGNSILKPSLGGDIIHSMYLPYVDIWRGDRSFSEIVRSACPHYSSHVVHRLVELPGQIRKVMIHKGISI